MNWLAIAGVVAVVGIVLAVGHISLTWANDHGWVYYRNPDAPRGRSLGLLEEIYQPSSVHVVDQKTLEDSIRDQAESSDPDSEDPSATL
jgi:pheromone shutdown protein TraB